MIRCRLVLLVFVAGTIGSSLASDVWVVREDGVGPVKIGMTLTRLNMVLHENFSMPENKDEQGCFYADTVKYAPISFMIVRGRLARIDVDGAGVSTAEGIRVGDSEQRARRVYGPRMRVEPHAYTGPEGHYLTIRSSNGRYGIRFETDGGTITRFYAGRFEAIQYIEGCE
jgi:hypothetical protein